MAKVISTPSISAMELRRSPGVVLDRVYYRNEPVVVEKSGEPRVAIIPFAEFKQIQATRQEAKRRVFARVKQIRANTRRVSRKSVENIIDEAVDSARRNASC